MQFRNTVTKFGRWKNKMFYNDDDDDDDDNNNNNNVHICTNQHAKPQALKTQTKGTHTCPSQCVKKEMSQCCGIKQYTQTEKLKQIGQI